jgi:hypothetical protein
MSGLRLLIPQARMESVALVIERQGVSCPIHPLIEVEIAHRERPKEPIDRPCQLVDR